MEALQSRVEKRHIYGVKRYSCKTTIKQAVSLYMPTKEIKDKSFWISAGISIDNDIYIKFKELKGRWEKETAFMNSMSDIVLNHNYQKIMSLGPKVIKYIFRAYKEENAHWHWALSHLCDVNPIKVGHDGDMEKIRQDWLNWAYSNSYLNEY